MSDKGRRMTDRLAVTPETHAKIREFALGLGVTIDATINFLLKKTVDDNDEHMAGLHLREEFKALMKDEKQK